MLEKCRWKILYGLRQIATIWVLRKNLKNCWKTWLENGQITIEKTTIHFKTVLLFIFSSVRDTKYSFWNRFFLNKFSDLFCVRWRQEKKKKWPNKIWCHLVWLLFAGHWSLFLLFPLVCQLSPILFTIPWVLLKSGQDTGSFFFNLKRFSGNF